MVGQPLQHHWRHVPEVGSGPYYWYRYKLSGLLFDYAEAQGQAFSFFGETGKPAGYMIVFCYCAVAYLIGWVIMKGLVPKYKPIATE